MPSTEHAPFMPPTPESAKKNRRPEQVSNTEQTEQDLSTLLRQSLQSAHEIAQRFAAQQNKPGDARALVLLMGKIHPDKFPNNPEVEPVFKMISNLQSALKGDSSYWQDSQGGNNLGERISAALQKIEQQKARKAEAERQADVSEAENLRQNIRSGVRPKPVKPERSVYINEPAMELGDEDIEYMDPVEESRRQLRILQNKELDLKAKIAEAEKKITLSDRWKQVVQRLKGEPAIGPYYRLNSLKAELEEIKQQIFLQEEDQTMAKIRREAKEEFKNNPPSFVKGTGRMARDTVRDAASSFIPGVESASDRDRRMAEEADDIHLRPEEFTNVAEFEASLERDPARAAQQRKDTQKANRERLQRGAEARRAQEESKNNPPSYIKDNKRMARDTVRDAVSSFIPGVESAYDRDRRMVEEADDIHLSPEEFTDVAEFEASLERDPARAAQQRKDTQKANRERLQQATQEQKNARQDARNWQENRYRELLGNRASEVMGTIDNLFAQMSPAEASKLGFSRDQYLDFASGLLHSATESWKDEKTGYTSDDYFKLAQRKLAEYNKKLGLPPDFVTGFGASKPERMSGLGNNSAREEGTRIANRAAGLETPPQARAGRRSSASSETMPAAREAKKPEEYEVDLGDLEKGPLDEQFDKLVKDASDTLGREKADVLWNKINKGLEAKQADIKAMNNYDYLNYRGGVEYVLRRSPNVKDKSLETALIFSIAELVKGTQDSQLEGKVMNVLNTLGLSKQDVSEILYPQGGTANVKNKRDRMNEAMGTYVMTPEEASKYAVDDNGKPLKAEKRGTSRTTSDINRRQNSRRYGGSTATGM